MKIKLLRKLRKTASEEVTIYSITRQDGVVTGIKLGFNLNCYKGLFSFGDTVEDVKRKVWEIYIANNIDTIRRRYKKYSVKNRK